MANVLVRGGVLCDGRGARRRRADVRVVGDRIGAVGILRPEPGERVIDAGGLVVAPGFIDTHSHADGGLFNDLAAETQVRQGITTAVVGQDGGSRFPLADLWRDMAKTPPAINLASFVGHGGLRGRVLGDDYKRPSTPAEIRQMRALALQEMRAGALGLSSGLEYDPGLYATEDEVVALAEVASLLGGIYISHVRDEENEALESFAELIRIARRAGLPAQISHIKLGSSPVWGKARRVLQTMADVRRDGVEITADVYPYTYWQSSIIVIIPTRDWSDRKAWEKGLAEIGGPQNVLLSEYTPDPAWKGKTLAQISEQTRRDPVTVVQEIVERTHGKGATGREGVVVTAMQEKDLETFLSDPHVMFCTDGGLKGSHPRGAGSYPRVFGRYVRERRLISLEEAVRKATSLPAGRMGLRDRGVVASGKAADLVVFDPDAIRDMATVARPQAPPLGMVHVLVNGKMALEGGRAVGGGGGRGLRRG